MLRRAIARYQLDEWLGLVFRFIAAFSDLMIEMPTCPKMRIDNGGLLRNQFKRDRR